ncbi:hypothetical protein A5630_07950 [Mycolicibacterium mucogenicum]|uniref:Uncharacterized protein n=2 Tax=Mycolicibacterium mucogenicum TaxID=56689 RepID=A0A8H2PIW4_MYCMU|nr:MULTISPECIES: hypothetical protein [Mycobacteriaceae]KAB7760840.1 hypothetical protein MMUC44124_05585 [Mycolicibacterium mucogenicum DSM 44124]OBJ36154.1 hypothetical protein A5630_07950 [Mycolicibacterium mucogenicum]QPG67955.1 hypothetical protein C1S78_020945 [Mycolicibacterium mucogenicum DSM 44124]SEB25519.1 hypothetical protein SAMN04488580_11714 [Mycobacterium sp. 283mftsu]
MTAADYDDAMARARAALAVLKRAAAELSTPGHDAEAAGAVLRHLRDDLHRQDAPSVAEPTRR